MTPEELKEIENRARNASNKLILDIERKEDFDYMNRGRADIYKLIKYIKELEAELENFRIYYNNEK